MPASSISASRLIGCARISPFASPRRAATAPSCRLPRSSISSTRRCRRWGAGAGTHRACWRGWSGEALLSQPPPARLGWAHIFSEHVAVDDAVEAIESVSHGDRSVRFVAAVTGPAAQACDAPACPGQAVGRMRVLLLDGAPLQLGLQCTQDVNLLGAEHAACGWTLAAGGARQRKLHGDGSGDERNDDELFENLAILDDALLDSQSLPFESPEQLFDIPAQAIPADHGECLHDSLDPVRGQQAPQDRLLARRSIDLAHLDGEQLDLRGSSGIRAVLGPLDTHAAEANGQFRPTGAAVFIRSRREIDLVAMRFRQGCHRRKQAAAAHKAAIPAGTRQKMGPRVRQARPFLINVTFAVIHDCDEGGLAQHSFRLLPALQPAMGFLRFNRKTLVVRSLGGGPAPHLRIDQPKALPALRINRQHGMHEQPHIAAVADRAEPLFAAALRLIVELARVLNREYVSTAGRRRRKHRPVRHHLRNRHGLIVKKAPKPDLLRSIISKPANADLLPLADPLDQQLADPSASFVPKIAKPCLRHRRPLESRWPGQNHAEFSPCKRNRTATSMNRTATSVPNLALKGGGWRRRRRVGVPPLGTFGACGVTPHPTRHSASKTRVNALKAGRRPPFRGRFGEDAMSEFILPLSSVEALDPDRVGPKAANLARLAHAGLPTPGGFCLTAAAYRAQVAALGLDDLLLRFSTSPSAEARKISVEIRLALHQQPIADDISQPLIAAWRAQCATGQGGAVRSSALIEDRADANFAGQFESFLGLSDDAEFLTAVRACWAALWTSNARRYMANHGLDPASTAMAVLIQPTIAARASGGGLSETADGGMLLSATWGLGSAIAQGEVVPDRIVLSRQGFVRKIEPGRKDRRDTCTHREGTA